MAAQRIAEMGAALLIDRAIGDPVRPTHPVRLMGSTITAYEKAVRPMLRGPAGERAAGAVLALGLPLATAWLVSRLLGVLPHTLRSPARVWLLATALGGRELADAAEDVSADLEQSPQRARERVGMIVGRDTREMTEEEVVRATVESVAESTSDGMVAPLLYGFAGGPTLALGYKAVSTLDSMVGYRDDGYRHFGWASARLDDLANFIPARITGVLALAVAGSGRNAFLSSWEDRSRHESPNAGLVEAAFAQALRVRLGGSARYAGRVVDRPALGREHTLPARDDIDRAVRLSIRVEEAALAGAAAVLLLTTLAHSEDDYDGSA